MKTVEDGTLRTLPEWPATTPEERLRKLEDVRSIQEAIAHYARAVDAKDAAGVAALFTEDGALCGPGHPPIQGRNRLARLYGKLLAPLTSSAHLVSNVQIQLVEPSRALAQCALWAWEGFAEGVSFAAEDGRDRMSWGRYEFTFVRESDSEWRVQSLGICFAGQAGAGARFAEHLARPWPPRPDWWPPHPVEDA